MGSTMRPGWAKLVFCESNGSVLLVYGIAITRESINITSRDLVTSRDPAYCTYAGL